MDGVLVIDKPADWTSHDVVARVRRLTRQKRAGHTGTLDPDATGVLLVCLGSATRLIAFTEDHRKTYRATLVLGVETDSQDAGGAVTNTRDASHLAASDLLHALERFRGAISQVPPMVSALHHGGERLYEIARRGEVVEREARPVTVFRLEASDFQPGERAAATLDVECSAGTYVRTLCHDIGAALGVGGHMGSLRRTAVGPFTERDAVSLEDLAAAAERGSLPGLLRRPECLLPEDWSRVHGDDGHAADILHGRGIPADGAGEHAGFFHGGELRAIMRRDGDHWRPFRVFPPG